MGCAGLERNFVSARLCLQFGETQLPSREGLDFVGLSVIYGRNSVMAKRYELSNEAWDVVADLFPNPNQKQIAIK